MAISFQDQAGCDYIWAQIQQKQKARNVQPPDSQGGARRQAMEVDYDQGVNGNRMIGGTFDDMIPEALDVPGETFKEVFEPSRIPLVALSSHPLHTMSHKVESSSSQCHRSQTSKNWESPSCVAACFKRRGWPPPC